MRAIGGKPAKTHAAKRVPGRRDRRARRPRAAPVEWKLRAALAERAKALNVNVSEIIEKAVEAAIQDAERARFLAENEAAIDQYNAFVAEHGVFSDELRQF
jgi:antitoxin CcdA